MQYDYSGKKLLAQIPITLQLSTTNNIIKGELQLNNTQTIQLQAIQQGNQLIFSQTTISEKYATRNGINKQQVTRNFVLKSLTLQAGQNPPLEGREALNGTLVLFNTHTHETDKPINIKLKQTNNEITNNNKPQTPNNIFVFPNPAKETFNVSFTLGKPSPVKINIYNMQGQLVYNKITEQLQQGRQTISLSLKNNLAGIYTAQITTNSFTQTTAFIYEK